MIDSSQCINCVNCEYNAYGRYCSVVFPLPQGDENGKCGSFVAEKTNEQTNQGH